MMLVLMFLAVLPPVLVLAWLVFSNEVSRVSEPLVVLLVREWFAGFQALSLRLAFVR